jgi:fused signal recognition particle receptor
MFNFIKNSLKKIYSHVTSQLGALFGRQKVDHDTLKELEILLLAADAGVETTRSIIAQLSRKVQTGAIEHGADLKVALGALLLDILNTVPTPAIMPRIHLLVGINGSGKTTFSGKLANYYVRQGKKVLLVAADTFRAAAPEQLMQWAQRTGAEIVLGKPNQDPASVVFAGCQQFKDGGYDVLIIDTAGRLQTKVNLMNELTKIKRTIVKLLGDQPINTLLTIDSMLGQNSFEQARLFKESTDVNGIALTKMDGTGKGGIVFSIVQQLQIPIQYISFGEQLEEFTGFEAATYVQQLLD